MGIDLNIRVVAGFLTDLIKFYKFSGESIRKCVNVEVSFRKKRIQLTILSSTYVENKSPRKALLLKRYNIQSRSVLKVHFKYW